MTNIPTAKKYGLIKFDESKTVIKSVKAVDGDTVEVTMNEPVIVDANNIELYANSKLIKVKDFETKNTILIINVEDELYNERQFKIVIKKLYDEDDNLTEGLEIYFTQPIDDKAGQVLLYDVYRNGVLYFEGSYKTLEIKMNTTVKNDILFIAKQHKFEENNRYEIRIKSDLKSKYNAHLNDSKGDQYSLVL